MTGETDSQGLGASAKQSKMEPFPLLWMATANKTAR
jgi:hypothetical protein